MAVATNSNMSSAASTCFIDVSLAWLCLTSSALPLNPIMVCDVRFADTRPKVNSLGMLGLEKKFQIKEKSHAQLIRNTSVGYKRSLDTDLADPNSFR